MNPPAAGDRWTLTGYPDILVTEVSGGVVRFSYEGKTLTLPEPEFLHKLSLSINLGATMSNATTTAPGPSGSHNAHARLSPSHSKCWSNCLAAIPFLEANRHRVPADSGSAESNEGTTAHDWAAKVLLKQIARDEVPESFRQPVVDYVDHCLALVPDGVSYQVEVSVPLFYQPDQKGTCDFAIVTDDKVTVRDLKYGRGVLVLAEFNSQMAIYAYSFIKTLEDIYDFTPETVIDMAPFQPRHREANDVKPWVTTLGELETFCKEIEYHAIQINAGLARVTEKLPCGKRDIAAAEILEAAPGLKFHPEEGDEGSCRWCRVKGFCEIRLAAAVEDTHLPSLRGEEMLALLPDLSKEALKNPVEQRVEDVIVEVVQEGTGQSIMPSVIVTDEYLVKIHARSKAIRRFLDDIEEHLTARAIAGNSVAGTKLVAGRMGNRAWTNEDEADTFLRGQGLKQDDRYDYRLKSPTKIEEILKEKLEKSTRTKNRFAELVSRSAPKPVLALVEDKREAISAPVDMLPDLSGDDEV